MVRPDGIRTAASWFLWQCRTQHDRGAGSQDRGRGYDERLLGGRENTPHVSNRSVQPAQSSQLRLAQEQDIQFPGADSRLGGPSHEHDHEFAADSSSIEVYLLRVAPYPSNPLRISCKTGEFTGPAPRSTQYTVDSRRKVVSAFTGTY